MSLTEEQRRKIEENRQRALAKRAGKQQEVPSIIPARTWPSSAVPVKPLSSAPTTAAANHPGLNFFTAKPAASKSFVQSNSKTGSDSNAVEKCSVTSAAGQLNPCPPKPKPGLDLGKNVAVTAEMVLISRHRFAVNVKFFGPLIELFKTMNTRQYDVQKRQWSFELQDYSTLIKQIQNQLGKAVTVKELPKSVVKALATAASTDRSIPNADLSAVDETLVGTLLPFQRDGVNFAIHHDGRVLVADDMGLGKTIQALCIAAYYRKEWPLLIVVPSSVRFTWQQQILEWLPNSVDPQQINIVLSGKDDCTSGLINVISYDLMVKCQAQLTEKRFKVIIMDESHFLKNGKTARTKIALPLLKSATRVILLSGTPALSRPAELYTQLAAVDPKLFPKFHEYGIRYCDGKQLPWGWDFSGSSNMTELQIILEERIMIRRLKRDVLHQLPSKYRTMVVLDPGSVKVNKIMKASHEMVDRLKGNDKRGALLEYFHSTGEAKIKAVREYILDLLESEHKFLLFAHHKSVLDAVEEVVKSKYKYIRIDGRTNPEQRSFFCDKFQDNEDVRLAILSITAANTGINLTAASLVVFAELFWNPGVLLQAEDRVHRIGQQDSVNVQYLVAKNTADDYIWPMIQQKLSVLGKAGLSKDDFEDTETKQLQDSKQRDLLQYFGDDAFSQANLLDIDEPVEGSAVASALPRNNAAALSVSASNQQTMNQYLKTSADAVVTSDQDTPWESVDSDATVDWADDMHDVIKQMNEDDFEVDEPLPKKPKTA